MGGNKVLLLFPAIFAIVSLACGAITTSQPTNTANLPVIDNWNEIKCSYPYGPNIKCYFIGGGARGQRWFVDVQNPNHITMVKVTFEPDASDTAYSDAGEFIADSAMFAGWDMDDLQRASTALSNNEL